MSVIMTLRMPGDRAKLEQYASENEDKMQGIVEKAKGHGLIAHRFYASDDGTIMVIDEWPDPESFQTFFQEAQSDIQSIMEAAGMSGEPQPEFWRKLETHDDVGWDA